MPKPNIFSQSALHKIVTDTMAETPIPDGHTNAVIGTVDESGAQVVVTVKLGKNDLWQVTGAVRHEWSGDNSVGASVVASW